MKKYLFLLLIITAVSCKSYREFLERPYNVVNAKDTIVDGRYINGLINERKIKFFFDTGATVSAIENLDLLGGKDVLNSDVSKKLVTAKGADGKDLSLYKIKTTSLYTNTYKSKGRYIIAFNQEQITNVCNEQTKRRYDGILGLDAFVNSETPVMLDYENNEVVILNELPDLKAYMDVDCIIKNNRIFLNAVINKVKFQLLLDSGNDAFMILQQNPFLDEQEDLAFETGIVTANNIKSFPLNMVYANRPINIGGIRSDENLISIVESFKTNGVGIQFINNYNWIIDFKHKKLYAKKIRDFDGSQYISKMNSIKYKVMAANGGVIIFHKNDPTNKHNVGDEIVSVDGIIISEENMCEFQDLLNSNNDWGKFKIETITKE